MGITLPLDKMTVTEKLEVMELLWESLSLPSPEWHGKILKEREEALEGIRKGMDDVKAGRVTPADEFFEKLCTKYGISFDKSAEEK